MFKKILFIFLFLPLAANCSYAKDYYAKIVIEYFCDHNDSYTDEFGGSYSSDGNTYYTAIYDGRLEEIKETPSPYSYDKVYEITGNLSITHTKTFNLVAKPAEPGYSTTYVLTETGQARKEIKPRKNPQEPFPHPTLWVKLTGKNRAEYRLILDLPDLITRFKSTETMRAPNIPEIVKTVDEEQAKGVLSLAPNIFSPMDIAMGDRTIKGEYNPQTGLITGSKIWNFNIARSLVNPYGGRGYTIVGFYFGDKPLKVTIEPENRQAYKEWLPSGSVILPNKTLAFKVQSNPKNYIELQLIDVSREKGVCLNYPDSVTARDSYDLTFVPEDNPGLDITSSGQKASSREKVDLVKAVVTSEDYGAFGRIKAFAVFNKGTPSEWRIPATFDGNDTSIVIPKDDNCNRIADSWEEENRIFGLGLGSDWDEDPEPTGQRVVGDGFTLFEEYRGFFVNSRHKRLNPNKKDLFIYDPDGLAAQSYFEQASRLTVHYINENEMDGDRTVNFNFTARATANRPQCAVVVRRKDGKEYKDEEKTMYRSGTTLVAPGLENTAVGPRTALECIVFPEAIRQNIDDLYANKKYTTRIEKSLPADGNIIGHFQRVTEEMIKVVTTHELGHAIGIEDHHKNVDKLPPGIKLKDLSGGGNRDCVMRYPIVEYIDINTGKLKNDDNSFVEYIEDVSKTPKTYCRDGNNCFGQIDLSR